ncbi:MAG: MotA/TolQ/ExbB proton channel family protein [Elusimicrobia bacterium]|nr:MotA/TolQ/ExbB proton channel family protein [Elusimicrobiota bacterium]
MDLMTVLGFAMGLGAVYLVMLHGDVVNLLFNLDAAILVFGGTIGSTFIAFPFRSLKQIPSALKLIFFPPPKIDFNALIDDLVFLAGISKKSGFISLSGADLKSKNPFLEKYIKKISEGVEKDIVLEGMKQEIFSISNRHSRTSGIFQAMATFSPIFGLLGTLIGVVQVLRNLTDPQSMGASMAIAVTTTFYGIFGANFLFLPASIKLGEYSSEEILSKELIAEGIESILNREVPFVTLHRLEAFLSKRIAEKQKK